MPVDTSDLRHYRTFAIVALGVASVFNGVSQARGASEAVGLLSIFGIASAATMWCVMDSMLRGQYYHRALQWITLYLWPLAVPAYLIRTRRWRGLLMAFGGFAFLYACELLGYATSALLFGR
jgi:hypothetical protein